MNDHSTIDAYGTLIEPTTLKIQRLLPGPIERCWAYLTESDMRRQWLAAGQLRSSLSDPTRTLGYAPIASASVLIKLTYYGDANLDGTINADDYALLDRGFAQHASTWQEGDFNYDGIINSQDYLLIDQTLFSQAQGFSPGFLEERESRFGAQYVTALLASLPEPSSVLACGLTVLTLRRRRHRGS